MRKLFTLKTLSISFFLALCFIQSPAQLLLNENFTGFTTGTNLAGQGSWLKGGSGPDVTVQNAAPLTYTDYNSGGSEYVLIPSRSGTTSRVYKGFTNTTVSTGTFYTSFLLNLSSATLTGDYFISLGDAAGGTNYSVRLFAKNSGAGYILGISKLSATGTYSATPTVLNFNQTYLIVIKITGVTGSANDQVNFWINPSLNSEPSPVTSEVSYTLDSDPSILGQFIWHNRSGNNPLGKFDGVRVAYGATSAVSWTNLAAKIPTAASVSIATPGTNAIESTPSSNGSFTINFSTPTTAASTNVGLAFSGSATYTSDYTVLYSVGTPTFLANGTGSLNVPANTSSITVTITPVDDAVIERDEEITLSLVSPITGYEINTGQVTINLVDNDVLLFNGAYSQDFNSLSNNVTNAPWANNYTINGWYTNRATYTSGTGSSNTGAVYSFGAQSSSERALGTVGSDGTGTVYYGVRFKNNTGTTITSLQISYTGEQWRNGGNTTPQTVNFSYQTGISVTSLTAGTFIPVTNLDFTSINNSATASALDGNHETNSTAIAYNITGLNIPDGNEVMFRWEDINHASNDHGLSIDDLTITNQPCTNPTAKPTALTFGTATETSIPGSFTAATPAANKYLVVVSTNNALTSDPVNGHVYQTGDNLGDGTVVGYSSSTNFTATDLSAGTIYYFFVFPVNTACIGGPNYLVTEPLTGSASTDAGLPPCAAPVQQASDLILSNPSINSIQGTFTAADANEYLVVRSLSASLTNDPVNGQTYNAGAVIGNATVVQRSTATSFTANGLAPNTQYYFFVFSLNSQNCLNGPVYNITSPATGNATTLPLPECITPASQPSNLTLNSTNNKITGTFNPGTGADSYLVIRSTSSTLSSSPVDNIDYNPGDNIGGGIVVSNNASTSFIETSLSQSTTYYIFIYSNNSNCTGGTKYLTTSPLTGSIATTSTPPNFVYFGNLHSHSDYSDGNKDNPGYTPALDYAYAKNAECLDFLGISEHNHYSNGDPGNLITTYHQGTIQAENFTAANPGFVAMYGMEWGTISGGGHVVIYGDGMNDLYGWESNVGGISGPNYDVFVQKGDYTGPNGLFKTINDDIATNTFATLAHPNSNDFNNISNTPYNVIADNAIVGTAVESGPAFSTNTTYSNPASSLYYKWYYDKLLAKGYHLGPTVDHDNHNTTFGKTTRSRTAVIAPALNRTEIVKAMREMRFYSTEDCDAVVDFSVNTKIMGSVFADRNAPTISASLTDLTTNTSNALIRVKFGIPGSEVLAVTVDSVYGSSLNYVHNDLPINATGYYYIHITNGDAEIITSPIWYTRLCVNTTNNNVVACESYTWPSNGQTYTVSGSYTHSYTDEAGCSNTNNLNLTITHPSTGDTTAIVCDSFTWYGITYTESGTPTKILKGYGGCDSTVTLHLTITHSSSHTTTVSNCESYTWSGPLGNGQTYTESGIYTNVTTNGQGCPHTETLNLTINPKPTVTIPDAYVLPAGVNANTVYNGYAPASILTVTANPGGGTPGYTYSWSVGSGLSAGATDQSSIQVSPNQAGNYSAQLTVTITDDKGCTATASITIHVIDVRSGNKGDKVKVCHNGSAVIIDGNAVQAHLNHGDNLGACPAIITSARTSNTQSVPAETISGADKPGLTLSGYTLSNYPNPFSTATLIRYHIPVDSKVSLKIYNGLGQVIATLFEGDRKAGSYSINLNAAQLTNGFYYCKLTAFSNQQQFVQSLKLSVGK